MNAEPAEQAHAEAARTDAEPVSVQAERLYFALVGALEAGLN